MLVKLILLLLVVYIIYTWFLKPFFNQAKRAAELEKQRKKQEMDGTGNKKVQGEYIDYEEIKE